MLSVRTSQRIMKKPDKQHFKWLNERFKSIQEKKTRKKIKKKRKQANRKRAFKLFPEVFLDRQPRYELISNLYKKIAYNGKLLEIPVDGVFGLEEDSAIDYFIDRASQIIEFRTKQLRLDLSNCTHAWPSAVTLLASLAQWVELTSHRAAQPLIASSTPKSDSVRGYLNHCGFYTYVERKRDVSSATFDSTTTAKIQRETKVKNLVDRENEVIALIRKYSCLTLEQIEKVNCIVLTEIFNNITEHGRAHGDQGWWILAQHHPSHKFISICLADNGIGIGNSLRTGKMREYIRKEMGSAFYDDGECIDMALRENISGSLMALPPRKSRFGSSTFERGGRKGLGLKRMRDVCRDLGIRFSIISHKGFLVIAEDGRTVKLGSKPGKVFAGTMYHLLVKAKVMEDKAIANN